MDPLEIKIEVKEETVDPPAPSASSPDIISLAPAPLPLPVVKKTTKKAKTNVKKSKKAPASSTSGQEDEGNAKKDDDENESKIRRSSRLKTLATPRRREVILEPRPNSPPNTQTPTPALKLKSRWRVSLEKSEGENNSEEVEKMTNLSLSSAPPHESVEVKHLVRKPGWIWHEEGDDELSEKLKSFIGVEENIWRSAERVLSRGHKNMVCDCFLTKEEIARGEVGCNEDCLNRLLMVECGPRCPNEDRCSNKKFQRKEYCNLEVFKTERKGHGLRTTEDIAAGSFVLEYVGEVLDGREFTKRTKEYAKENVEHFYFMALKSDAIIDATLRGNCSRFINHSCEPNCETQKWTVNGEIRIGFFSIRDLSAGEEITFDYQFQRYGKEAQKCFCNAPKCRGWIDGGDNEGSEDVESEDDDEESEVEEEKIVTKKTRVKREGKKISALKDVASEEELSVLEESGLRNKSHTLALSRLVVRADKWDVRTRLLHVLLNGDAPCRRLFLDYNGLNFLCSWMTELPLPSSDSSLVQDFTNEDIHKLFLKVLESLPIPNKSMLQDSKMLSAVEKWATSPSQITIYSPIKPLSPIKIESEEVVENTEASSLICLNTQPEITSSSLEILPLSPQELLPINEENIKNEQEESASVAIELKTEEPIIETEMEVDRKTEILTLEFPSLSAALLASWSSLVEVFKIPKKERVEQLKEHEREADSNSSHPPPSTPLLKPKIKAKIRQTVTLQKELACDPSLSKEEKRALFARRAADMEKERVRQREVEELIVAHTTRCRVLGLDPSTVPVVDLSFKYYLNPSVVEWVKIDPTDPALCPEVKCIVAYGEGAGGEQGLRGEVIGKSSKGGEDEGETDENVFPEWPQGLLPPPPLPPQILPKNWRMGIDEEGRCYYYDIRKRVSQWVPPPNISSDEEEEECSSAEGEESEDEEENQNREEEEIANILKYLSWMEERSEKRKRSGLVTERIMSPRTEEELNCFVSPKVIKEKKQERKMRTRSSSKISKSLSPSSSSPKIKPKAKSLKIIKQKPIPLKTEEKDVIPGLGSPDSSSAFILADEKTSDKSEEIASTNEAKNSILQLVTSPPVLLPSPQVKKSKRGSERDKKLKAANIEKFRSQMASLIVQVLGPYRKPGCLVGHIGTNDDFKHLARKLTHSITLKELKHCRDGKTPVVSDSVKHKTKEFVKKYMGRFQGPYVKSPSGAADDSFSM